MNEWNEIKKDGLPEFIVIDNSREYSEIVIALAKDGWEYLGRFERFRYDESLIFQGIRFDSYGIDKEAEYIDASTITHWIPLPRTNSVESIYMYSEISIFDKQELADFKEPCKILDKIKKPSSNQRQWWLRSVTNTAKKEEN